MIPNQKYSILRGFRDVLPDEIPYWHKIRSGIDKIAKIYGFSEIKTPTLEETELFFKNTGEFTDVVSKEMYTFIDQSGKSVTLRPEGTPSCIRAVVENNLLNKYPLPLKFYYVEDMFRHEKPQSGRFRQHTQMGFEIIGDKGPNGEAELITLLMDFYKTIGLTELSVEINSIGCKECREPFYNGLRDFLKSNFVNLCENCKTRKEKNPLRTLDCKEIKCREIFKDAPKISDFICEICKIHFGEFKKILDECGHTYNENPSLVRGLDYYSKTTFEILHKTLGAQNTIAGGGRYDYLVSNMGGGDVPCVGFGAGIERIILAMQNEGIKEERNKPIYSILVMDENYASFGRMVLKKIRDNGKSGIMNFEPRAIKKLMQWADKNGSKNAIIIGEREIKESILTVKDLTTGIQSYVSVGDLDKNSMGTVSVSTDNAELKQPDNKLHETNEKYQKMMDGSNDCIYLLNKKGQLVDANRKAHMLNDVTDIKSFIGIPFSNFATSEFRSAITDNIELVLAGETRQFYYETLSSRRIYRSWNATFLPISDVAGNIVNILNISRDLTLEHESRAREEFFKEYANNILANLPISVLVVNRSGEITFANRNFLLKMKLSEPNVIGKPIVKVLTADVFANTNLLYQIEEVLKTREVIVGQRFDYHRRNFIYNLMPLKETDGRRHNVAIMMEDVTDRTMLEEQLRHSEKLAMMGQFAAGVTHEINNPLSIIKGNVQYLRDQIKKGVDFMQAPNFKELKDTLAAVEHEATRCADIIGELLHFSKRTTAKQKNPVEIRQLIRHVLHLMKRQLILNKIKVVQELALDTFTVRGNRKLLQQVVMNLILNASQAMGKKGGRITIKTLQEGKNVHIIVKDNGCGIPKEMQQFIFNPFFTTRGSGTGLGLSVVHSIVEDHGGTISVRSWPKRGSVFTVILPAV